MKKSAREQKQEVKRRNFVAKHNVKRSVAFVDRKKESKKNNWNDVLIE